MADSGHWSGMAGEMFVASECFRRKWHCAITMGNTKKIDLLVHDENRNITKTIDVKSIKGGSVWDITKKSVKVSAKHFYVLVDFGGVFEDNIGNRPNCYIIPSKDIKSLIWKGIGRGGEGLDRREVRGSKYVENWNLIFPGGQKPTMNSATSVARAVTCSRCGRKGHNRLGCKTKRIITCGNCGKKGHNKVSCKVKRKTKRTITCGNCGKKGHNKSTCKVKRKR